MEIREDASARNRWYLILGFFVPQWLPCPPAEHPPACPPGIWTTDSTVEPPHVCHHNGATPLDVPELFSTIKMPWLDNRRPS